MPSLTVNLTDTFKKIIEFKNYSVLYFNLEVENFEGPFLEFTFGNPNEGAGIELRVPNQCSLTRDGRPLAGVLWGRCQTPGSTAVIQLMIW